MRLRRVLTLLCVFALLLTSLVAQAETVVDRIGTLEEILGMSAGDVPLEARLRYLEEQLGITAAPGATLEERISALEAALGVGGGSDSSGEVYPLQYMEPFAEEDFRVNTESGRMLFGTDNYGTQYATVLYSDANLYGWVDYYLGGEYTSFMGTLYINGRAVKEGYSHAWGSASFSIYGDGKLLYSTSGFDSYQKPQTISVDVTGVEFLRIQFDQNYYYDTGLSCPLACLGDPQLIK